MINSEPYFWSGGLKFCHTLVRRNIDLFFKGLKCYGISLVLL
jgi:hypothetical protein